MLSLSQPANPGATDQSVGLKSVQPGLTQHSRCRLVKSPTPESAESRATKLRMSPRNAAPASVGAVNQAEREAP